MGDFISVAMTTRNGRAFLPDQIRSILGQLGPEDELVVSDDGSSDTTLPFLEDLRDSRIRVLKQAGGLGPARNFELALAATRGKFIFLSDQDDIWLPGRVACGREDLERHWLSLCDCEIVDSAGSLVHPSFFCLRRVRPGFARNLWRNGYHGCCIAIRRELLEYALPFPHGLPTHDWWLGLLAEKLGTAHLLPKALVQYRRHGGNASFDLNASGLPPMRQLYNRLCMWRAVERRLGLRGYPPSERINRIKPNP